jgi:hypothetical protein
VREPWLNDLPEQIRQRITVNPPEVPCRWISNCGLDKDGYARLNGTGLHRVVYELLTGEKIPAKFVVDHVAARGCTRHNCVWLPHLEVVTVRTNILRGDSFAAINFRKTNCSACGAEYDILNTYVWHGRRDCRACIRRRVREYKGRQREQAERQLPELAQAA